MSEYGGGVYVENIYEAHMAIQQFSSHLASCSDDIMFVGLDTETAPQPGGSPDDGLRWWGNRPGMPFLYIVGWSPKLGHEPAVYYAIPDTLEWVFRDIVEIANATPKVEWVYYNRTFDLGMVEVAAGIKITGISHEAFTACRTACFIPDWYEKKKLKQLGVDFLDPEADAPLIAMDMWKASYETARNKALTDAMKGLGRNEAGKIVNKNLVFTKKELNECLADGRSLPPHVAAAYQQWQVSWPPITYDIIPKEILIPYAVNDVRLTLWLFWVAYTLIKERGTLHIYQNEQDLYHETIRDQSVRGWRVDVDKIVAAKVASERKLEILEAKLRSLLMYDYHAPILFSDKQIESGFNPNSNPQMLKLINAIGIPVPNLQDVSLNKYLEDKEGKPTEYHEVLTVYAEHKLYTKLHGTYVESILKWSHWDGFCHPSVRQDGAFTGRQSVIAPALQTIPKKEVEEFSVRDFFLSDGPDSRLWMFDFSGMEVVVLAEYCRDPIMLEALRDGADFHSMLAMKAFSPARNMVSDVFKHMHKEGQLPWMSDEDVEGIVQVLHVEHLIDHKLFKTVKDYFEENKALKHAWKRFKGLRQAAKTGMFAIVYGAGAEALSTQMTEESGIYISVDEAQVFKTAFFNLYPGAKELFDDVMEKISMRAALDPVIQHNRTCGWVRNMFGRLYLMEPRDSYKVVNWLVQGTCAEIMKEKLIRSARYLKVNGFKSRIILSIHDEIVLNLIKSEEKQIVPMIIEIMQDNPILEAVGLKVEASFCTGSWATKQTFHSWEQLEEVA